MAVEEDNKAGIKTLSEEYTALINDAVRSNVRYRDSICDIIHYEERGKHHIDIVTALANQEERRGLGTMLQNLECTRQLKLVFHQYGRETYSRR